MYVLSALHKSIKTSKSNISSLVFVCWAPSIHKSECEKATGSGGQRFVRKIFLHLAIVGWHFTMFFFFTKTPSPSPFFVSQPLYKSQFQHVDAYDNARGFRKKGLKGAKGGGGGDCQRQRICGASAAGCHMSWPPAPVNTRTHLHLRIHMQPKRTTIQAQWDQLFCEWVCVCVCGYCAIKMWQCACVWVSSRKSFCAISKMPKTVKGPLLSGQSNVVLKVSVVLPFRQLRHRSHGATVNLFVSRDCRQFNVVLKHSWEKDIATLLKKKVYCNYILYLIVSPKFNYIW